MQFGYLVLEIMQFLWMIWIEFMCVFFVCIYKCLNIVNRLYCLYLNIVGDFLLFSLKFMIQNCIIYVLGMEGNICLVGDDLENFGIL